MGQRLVGGRRRHRGVAVVLGITVGALVGIEGYNFLDLLGLGPATGIISSLVNTRELAPIAASLAFATQAGCRFTAQLGSMRIAEEIDALDSLAIRPIPYLVTTRLMASVVAVIPLYVACLAVSYVTTQVVVYIISGGSSGSYLHYFSLMLSGQDIVYSLIKTVIFVWISSTVQCYYGFYASGGPEGVGVAAGHAMRASITVVIMVNMLLTMALWSVDPAQGSGDSEIRCPIPLTQTGVDRPIASCSAAAWLCSWSWRWPPRCCWSSRRVGSIRMSGWWPTSSTSVTACRNGPTSNITVCSSAWSTASRLPPTATRTSCTSTSNPNTHNRFRPGVTARVVPSNVFAVSSVQLVDRGPGAAIRAGAHIPEDDRAADGAVPDHHQQAARRAGRDRTGS